MMAMTATPTLETGAPLAGRLRLAVARLARRLRQQSGEGLTPSQWSALATIERAGPITIGDLARCERVQPPTATNAVNRLERERFVARTADPDDRRSIRVSVTPTGRRLLQRTRSRKDAYLDRRLRTLSDHERATLARAAEILERLAQDTP